jgi:hypothetical protein
LVSLEAERSYQKLRNYSSNITFNDNKNMCFVLQIIVAFGTFTL